MIYCHEVRGHTFWTTFANVCSFVCFLFLDAGRFGRSRCLCHSHTVHNGVLCRWTNLRVHAKIYAPKIYIFHISKCPEWWRKTLIRNAYVANARTGLLCEALVLQNHTKSKENIIMSVGKCVRRFCFVDVDSLEHTLCLGIKPKQWGELGGGELTDWCDKGQSFAQTRVKQ